LEKHPQAGDELVARKLQSQPIEDFRIDFEDGYGQHTAAEEDEDAARAGRELAGCASPPPRIGLRVKSMRWRERVERTLERFLEPLAGWATPLVLTVPKVEELPEIEDLVHLLEPLEARYRLLPLELELMVESPRGLATLPDWLAAAQGRCRAIHLGPYDFLASCGILEPEFAHPLLDAARARLVFHLPRSIWLADGPTTRLPLGDDVAAGWEQHRRDILHSQRLGFHQGWDLHPAQLVSRYRTVFGCFRERLPEVRARLAHFRAQAEQATALGSQFDDFATVRSLEAFLERGLACGALAPDEV